jgi:GNAT superfamily N-acetyltransferase
MTTDRPPGLLLRQATPEDLPAVLELFELSGIDPPGLNEPDRARQHWNSLHALPGARVLVAEHQGRVVGTLSLFVLPLLAHGGLPSMVVEDVATHPDMQGQGIGRALMHEAMAIARANGCYKLALSSNLQRTKAHGFYDDLGFQRHGISFVVPLEYKE